VQRNETFTSDTKQAVGLRNTGLRALSARAATHKEKFNVHNFTVANKLLASMSTRR